MAGLEELDDLEELFETDSGIWIVKDLTSRAVAGPRHTTEAAARLTLNKAQKDYPNHKFEIRKVR